MKANCSINIEYWGKGGVSINENDVESTGYSEVTQTAVSQSNQRLESQYQGLFAGQLRRTWPKFFLEIDR